MRKVLFAALLLGACNGHGHLARTSGCMTVEHLPVAPTSVRDRLTPNPSQNAMTLANSIREWQQYSDRLSILIKTNCAGSLSVCAKGRALPPRPASVREHLAGNGVDDSALLALSLREWQSFGGQLAEILNSCE